MIRHGLSKLKGSVRWSVGILSCIGALTASAAAPDCGGVSDPALFRHVAVLSEGGMLERLVNVQESRHDEESLILAAIAAAGESLLKRSGPEVPEVVLETQLNDYLGLVAPGAYVSAAEGGSRITFAERTGLAPVTLDVALSEWIHRGSMTLDATLFGRQLLNLVTQNSNCTGSTNCTSETRCTSEMCTGQTECTGQTNCTGGSACTSGNDCTVGAVCTNGTECTGSVYCTANDDACTDGTACTGTVDDDGGCTAGGQCTFSSACTYGNSCTQGGGCTIGKECTQGSVCTGADPGNGNCTDGVTCTGGPTCTDSDWCTYGPGCTASEHCTDGPECTASDACTRGANCTQGDTCTSAHGGANCTGGETCTAGKGGPNCPTVNAIFSTAASAVMLPVTIVTLVGCLAPLGYAGSKE